METQKRGRPSEGKTGYITVRLSPDERDLVAKNAAAAGASRSEYCRQRALNYEVVARKPALDDAAMRELAAIGNNLNQLAHAANVALKSGAIDAALYAKIDNDLAAIWPQFDRLADEVRAK